VWRYPDRLLLGYDRIKPSEKVSTLIDEIDSDPTHIF
jgi:hypothetical protein